MTQDNKSWHRYRWYSNTNWGPCYDPETKAHYCSASDVDALKKHYGGSIDIQSLQVHTGSGYEWVTDTPAHLGGISKQWHGERI